MFDRIFGLLPVVLLIALITVTVKGCYESVEDTEYNKLHAIAAFTFPPFATWVGIKETYLDVELGEDLYLYKECKVNYGLDERVDAGDLCTCYAKTKKFRECFEIELLKKRFDNQ